MKKEHWEKVVECSVVTIAFGLIGLVIVFALKFIKLVWAIPLF